MSDELAGLKALQRAIWSAGGRDAISELFWDAGAVVADAAAIEPGMRALDGPPARATPRSAPRAPDRRWSAWTSRPSCLTTRAAARRWPA
jgi:hypothetical protein